jgi:hypothetical protein
MLRSPDEPVTPQQLQVIAWTIIGVLLIGGGVALYFSWSAAAQNPAGAAEIRPYGLAMWALAALIIFVKRLIGWLLD